METLRHLLNQIYEINRRYAELAKLSGDNFNVFSILGLSSNELSHSKIIAELLNPQGCHEQGDLFLKLFLTLFRDEERVNDFKTENAKVEVEKFIGSISTDNTKGGRIDIVITGANPKDQILIENKIYASDREKQIFRYTEFNKEALMLYLTLYGVEASEKSLGNVSSNGYRPVSYKETIVQWLEKCRKESVERPLVRETISQYINLIKSLTGQTKNKEMENEIINLLVKDIKNVESAFIISDNIDSLKREIIKKVLIPQMEELAKDFDMEFSIKSNNYFDEYWGFWFAKKEWKYVTIAFTFDARNFRDLVYGFSKQMEDTSIPSNLSNELKRHGENAFWWPLYYYLERYRNWDKDAFIAIVSEDKKMKLLIESKIKELLEIGEGLLL